MVAPRDHGGGLDAARARFGGTGWIDLSTGINPEPYPLPDLPSRAWTALPDRDAQAALVAAARAFWQVPEAADILPAPGASALIARLPLLARPGPVHIPGPTYNEHAAAFRAAGHTIGPGGPT
ncbi:MAG: aminotransferase class I/II-fold pyridoxal phosphate-dependent enzyme, partial [Pseudomonadota bacterium]